MLTVKASEFKAKCLALMDEVALTGESICVTKHGKPIIEVRPIAPTRQASPFGVWRNRTRSLGDIIEPVVPAEDWDALK